MKILLIFTFFIFGLLIVKIMFHSYFEKKKNGKVLTFTSGHPNFEVSASL